MISRERGILFLGDSFTWGEGLEFYCNTPKWIAERDVYNSWQELYKKQDKDSILFRYSNRFPNLVGNHFGVKHFTHDKNGGNIASSISTAEDILFDPSLDIDAIVIQFSHFNRNHLHLRPGCFCDFCVNTESATLYSDIFPILEKLINYQKINTTEQLIINYFENKLKIKWNHPDFLIAFEKDMVQWYEKFLDDFINYYIKKWESAGKRKIYYINSWDPVTSSIVENNSYIRKNMIQLIGYDGKKYTSWEAWASTFKYKSISYQFPKTCNDHPTLIQHKFLANSIIQHLKEISYE